MINENARTLVAILSQPQLSIRVIRERISICAWQYNLSAFSRLTAFYFMYNQIKRLGIARELRFYRDIVTNAVIKNIIYKRYNST